MNEQSSADAFLPPVHVNSFGIPNKIDIMHAYQVYKPSKKMNSFLSERGRTIFAEIFIEDPKLGPLSDLAVCALPKIYGAKEIPIVKRDPLKVRVHYDSLDVDLPLEQCYDVDDDLYWRRVVLAKHRDKSLVLKKSYPWKNVAISLKFVELVEECPAEYWPEEEMKALAEKIRTFMTEMHITKLRPLQERAFEEYFEESDSSIGSEESTEESSELSSPRSSQNDDEDDEGEEEEEGEGDDEGEENGERRSLNEKAARRMEIRAREAAEKDERRRKLRAEREARRVARQERRKIREAKKARELSEPEPEPVKSKKKTKVVESVFDISVSEDEDELAETIDRRNLEKFLARKKKYQYPPEHCHHIDLRFVGDFIHLTSFTIEFKPPEMQLDYHDRNFNFSYLDIQHLADGIVRCLQLKTFRLINSRMDARKLEILIKALRTLPEIEELDFTNDQLQDDCGSSIFDFFKHNVSLKRLELRGNYMDTNVLEKLSMGLEIFGGTLEYLGLAGNWLGDEGIHALVNAILGTDHINTLCLRGAHISSEAIICCIANELIRNHTPLIELDITAMEVGERAAVELIKALDTNKRILRLPCQATDMPIDILTDIRVALQRNQYIVDNPYIGDETKTEEEINAWVNRVKEPMLLEALNRVKKMKECMETRPEQFRRLTLEAVEQVEEEVIPQVESDIWSLDKIIMQARAKEYGIQEEKVRESIQPEAEVIAEPEPFSFDPNKFNQEELLTHVDIPGPGERFYYFRAKIRRGFFDDEQAPESFV